MLKRNTSEILEAQAVYGELKIYLDAYQNGLAGGASTRFEVEKSKFKVQGQICQN